MASSTIIQWNTRGLKANFNEMHLLLQDTDAAVFCLQETFLKEKKEVTFKQYSSYDFIGPLSVDNKPTGGVSIFVKNSIPHRKIELDTDLQAIAVSVSSYKTITLCSIYLSPSLKLDISDLYKLIDQLPASYILLGNFNSHNTLWGCRDMNPKGRKMEDLINKTNLSLFNDGTYTYIHPATGSKSAIDLTLCHPTLFLDFKWEVNNDLCGSDHFPIFLQSTVPLADGHVQKWKFHKADWAKFQLECDNLLKFENSIDSSHPMEDFIDDLTVIAENNIPKTLGSSRSRNKPWFTEEVKIAIRNRKKALRVFKIHPTLQNKIEYKKLYAIARRMIRQSKRTTWRNYVSQLNSQSSVKKTWDMIRKISGKGQINPVKQLVVSGQQITDKIDIANTLGTTISKNSSCTNYTETFQS